MLVSLLALAGCGGVPHLGSSNGIFYLSPGGGLVIDTNCTGCNSATATGGAVEHFRARLIAGGEAEVTWSLSGGDPQSGPGSITDKGLYSPPAYLTTDEAEVHITATLASGLSASSTLYIRPGFLQPISPENASLGAAQSIKLTGTLALVGGNEPIHFHLAANAEGSGTGKGSLSEAHCTRPVDAYASCSVTYTAPAQIPSLLSTWIVAEVPHSPARNGAVLLLNPWAIKSSPTTHQTAQNEPLLLGSSGGSMHDFDARGNRVSDCCGGTLGALLADAEGHRFLLGNNHVLARSDQGSVGDTVLAPGLIDNNCTPSGAVRPVARLSHWLPLATHATNADAALAELSSAASGNGAILELGERRPDGSLAPAEVGTSANNGRGIYAAPGARIAKSGRTTGLTCGTLTATDLEVLVDYYHDCAETQPYLTHRFTHQIAVSGNQFTDAGDSGSLLVDAASAEPVGLYFAGGRDLAGVAHAIATPAPDLLTHLESLTKGLHFVGGPDHAVSCLDYGDNTAAWASEHPLSSSEGKRQHAALFAAQSLIKPSAGVLGTAPGLSLDHPGEAAILLFVDSRFHGSLPQSINGVRTRLILTTPEAVSAGTAANTPQPGTALSAAQLAEARNTRQAVASSLFHRSASVFGVGLAQSLDNPREAALLVMLDRHGPATPLPATLHGMRLRILAMDRLHVTRGFSSAPTQPALCPAHP